MERVRPLMLGVGLGAALMYLFDARWGNRRRALVREVENRLEVHREPGDVPSLQGAPQRRTVKPELAQESWTPLVRMLGALSGTALAASTFTLGGAPRIAGGALGLGLLARSVTNIPVKRLVGVGSGRRAVDIHKTIDIDAPVDEVFDFYSNFENFPRFMANIRDVRDLGEGRSHWVVDGPGGISAEWNAKLTRFEPDRLIAWRSEEDTMVGNAGIVRFDPAPNGGTRLTVRMSYIPPAGALGHALVTLFNSNPKQAMNEDLVRLKSLIEAGKTSVGGERVRREELAPRQSTERRQPEERAAELARAPRETEVPLGEWKEFCETFGQQHAGWLTTVETRYLDDSQSTIATEQPLHAMSCEQHEGGFDVRLVLGDDENEQRAHTVNNVESLHLQTNDEGAHEGLRIGTAGGSAGGSAGGTTTLRFRSPASPEMVDGLP